MDGGTHGLYLLPHVEATRRVLVFDAIDLRLSTRHAEGDAGQRGPAVGCGKMSLHSTAPGSALAGEVARRAPDRSRAVGVQPQMLDDFGGSLTEVVGREARRGA